MQNWKSSFGVKHGTRGMKIVNSSFLVFSWKVKQTSWFGSCFSGRCIWYTNCLLMKDIAQLSLRKMASQLGCLVGTQSRNPLAASESASLVSPHPFSIERCEWGKIATNESMRKRNITSTFGPSPRHSGPMRLPCYQSFEVLQGSSFHHQAASRQQRNNLKWSDNASKTKTIQQIWADTSATQELLNYPNQLSIWAQKQYNQKCPNPSSELQRSWGKRLLASHASSSAGAYGQKQRT